MENNMISEILMIVLAVMIFILMVLFVVLLVLKSKSNKVNKNAKKVEIHRNNSEEQLKQNKKKNKQTAYTKESIFDFMEFDQVVDNMITQKNGKRYIMVVECQGVNYDLMSSIEKVAVEEGFQQFLNTLRDPIQIYIQTRTINLEKSINRYKDKVRAIESKYNQMNFEFNTMKQSGEYSNTDLQRYYFELTKQRNLLEYGRDIVDNTRKMSLNKNILNRKYYIIIPFYPEEGKNGEYAVEELRNMAFSELYTKSQAIIRTLSSCSISGRILNSNELIDLLYVAYNREGAEVLSVEKAIMAGYDDLYSTAPDVFDKKINILDEEIRNKAIDLVNEKVEKVKSKKQKIADEKETDMEKLIKNMAEIILSENEDYVGRDIAEEAIADIHNDLEEGDKKDVKEQKTATTRKTRI